MPEESEIIDCAGILPERTVNGDVMLCTDPINAALVEGLPLIKVLSESLKEMTDSVVRERNAGVITADKCPVVLLPESVVGHIGMQHLNRGGFSYLLARRFSNTGTGVS